MDATHIFKALAKMTTKETAQKALDAYAETHQQNLGTDWFKAECTATYQFCFNVSLQIRNCKADVADVLYAVTEAAENHPDEYMKAVVNFHNLGNRVDAVIEDVQFLREQFEAA